MTEFSTVSDGFTHNTLSDGADRRFALQNGSMTMSRFGMFSLYHINTSGPMPYCQLPAQPQSEVRLVFVSSGTDVEIGCDSQMKSFGAGESNCLLVKEGCVQNMAVLGDGPAELFMLVVALSDISLSMTANQSHLRDFFETKGCRWLLADLNPVFGIRKISVVQQILREKKPAYLQAAYIQVKLAELWLLFLEKVGEISSEGRAVSLRPEEQERMRKVRDMLHDHPAASYSLVSLAHAVGTNETTLKTHFKAVYGVTVFGYLTACRMERAKALLAEGRLKVGAVAQEVGYKYASHFSTAFRKYFGYLPTKFFTPVCSFLACSEAEWICLFATAA